jgi:predicted ATP-grasp superfamily ATP-dependent carboligase
VGVDLVLALVPDQPDVVIEVNPRLTTSYVGLRKLTSDNLMQAMLDLAAGRPVQLSFLQATVTFDADGNCSEPAADSGTAGDKPSAS